MATSDPPPPARLRREPPAFRPVTVAAVERRGPRMVRVTLTGPSLAGLAVDRPAASVRLLVPSPGADGLVVPTWNGNEFLLPDGRRPIIRTFTPPLVPDEATDLALDVVDHEGGVVSAWARSAPVGGGAAVSGPGRGYDIDPAAPSHLLAGDETALPAIAQLLVALPPDRPVTVHVEAAHPDARMDLPAHPRGTVTWWDLPPGAPPGGALVGAVRTAGFDADTRLWVAGEAAGVQRIRRHLADERRHPRAHATVRGYWKVGRAGE